MENRFERFKENENVANGASMKEVKKTKKKKRKGNSISVINVPDDIFDYVDEKGITMANFARMSMQEKMERDR